MKSPGLFRALSIISFILCRLSYATPLMDASSITTHPEVVPGIGLPSLASLNLTSAQLYAIPSLEYEGAYINYEIDPACGPSGLYANRDSILACYNYMHALDDSWRCDVTADTLYEFCRSGEGVVLGVSWSGNAEQSSCKDVANGVVWILNSCINKHGDVAGLVAAWGNENMLLYAGIFPDDFLPDLMAGKGISH